MTLPKLQSLPKRLYIVKVKRGEENRTGSGTTLQEAMAKALVPVGSAFSYKVYEGQNQVECRLTGVSGGGTHASESAGKARWVERGKGSRE